MERKPRNERGFTLVELLITIAIMGIVSVVMIQTMTAIVLNSARNRNASVGEVELRRFAEKVRTAPYLTCGTPVHLVGVDQDWGAQTGRRD